MRGLRKADQDEKKGDVGNSCGTNGREQGQLPKAFFIVYFYGLRNQNIQLRPFFSLEYFL